jgi:hypothetical protein
MAEIRLKMNCREPNTVMVDNRGIVYPQLAVEKFFQSHMKIVKESRVIYDSRMIDISETDFDKRTESHLPLL